MKNRELKFVGREDALDRLLEFISAQGSGLMHLRGRRRIGKSWLLMELKSHCGGLYFQGEQDSSTKQLQRTLAYLWDEYVGHQSLSRIRQRDLTWDVIFAQISDHARLHVDEIHWRA